MKSATYQKVAGQIESSTKFKNPAVKSETASSGVASFLDAYRDLIRKTHTVKIAITPNVASLKPYTHPHYPGFPLKVPDVYRAALFIEELAEFERKGELPNLIYILLPCNHTVGTLPGHPESGEERFAVRRDPDSSAVYAEVSAFSRPATWWSKAGGPFVLVAQRIIAKRYVLKLEPDVFRLVMDGIMLAAGLSLL